MVKMAGDLVMEFHKGISDFGMQNNTCKIPIKANSLTAYLAWGLCSLKPPNSEFGECDLGQCRSESNPASPFNHNSEQGDQGRDIDPFKR